MTRPDPCLARPRTPYLEAGTDRPRCSLIVGSVKVLHTLRPFAVAMAGNGEFDPWKD